MITKSNCFSIPHAYRYLKCQEKSCCLWNVVLQTAVIWRQEDQWMGAWKDVTQTSCYETTMKAEGGNIYVWNREYWEGPLARMMEGRQGRDSPQTLWMESIKKYTGSSMVALHDWQMAELDGKLLRRPQQHLWVPSD